MRERLLLLLQLSMTSAPEDLDRVKLGHWIISYTRLLDLIVLIFSKIDLPVSAVTQIFLCPNLITLLRLILLTPFPSLLPEVLLW